MLLCDVDFHRTNTSKHQALAQAPRRGESRRAAQIRLRSRVKPRAARSRSILLNPSEPGRPGERSRARSRDWLAARARVPPRPIRAGPRGGQGGDHRGALRQPSRTQRVGGTPGERARRRQRRRRRGAPGAAAGPAAAGAGAEAGWSGGRSSLGRAGGGLGQGLTSG